MAKNTKRQLARLRRIQQIEERKVLRHVERARRNVARSIRAKAKEKGIALSARKRNELYKAIGGHYGQLGQELDQWALELTGKVAPIAHGAAVAEIGSVVKFDRSLVKEVFGLVHPDNEESIAGVFTKNMAKSDIQALRGAFIDSYRQANVEGLTANKTAKLFQSKWDAVAGNVESFRFVDAAGRKWSNARYMQMLVRTTSARVYRESYINTLTENGDDLARIVAVGDSCPSCVAWNGVIVSVSGSNPNYPSYQDAVSGGYGHPNCDCLLDRMDEDLDKENIENQSNRGNVEWDDVEQVAEYSKEFPNPI